MSDLTYAWTLSVLVFYGCVMTTLYWLALRKIDRLTAALEAKDE